MALIVGALHYILVYVTNYVIHLRYAVLFSFWFLSSEGSNCEYYMYRFFFKILIAPSMKIFFFRYYCFSCIYLSCLDYLAAELLNPFHFDALICQSQIVGTLWLLVVAVF